MHLSTDYLSLFIVCGIAWLVPMLCSQLRLDKIPTVAVEIIAGFIIGTNVLNILPDEPYLPFLSLTGFIFLMFLSGLEIDVNQIFATFPRRKITYTRFLKNPLLVGTAIYIVTLVLSIAAAKLLSNFVEITNIWYFALIMSTSSVGIIVPVLKNRGEIGQHFGQMIILAAAVADILSILFFTFTASYLKNGFHFKLFLIFILIAVFFLSWRIGKYLVRILPIKRLLYQLAHAASQIRVRGSILLILLFVIVSQKIDAEVILGAFLAGIILSIFTSKDRSTLMIKLDGIGYGFFIPIFFIMVGANLDISSLKAFDNSFLFLGLLLLSLYLVKVLPAFIWTRLFGFKRALSGGLLLSSRLSLIIAAAQIGLHLNVITPAINASIIIMAVFTCFLSPILYAQMNRGKKFKNYQAIIIGGSSVGVLLARRMNMHGFSTPIIDSNKEKVKELLSKGFYAILGNGADRHIYKNLDLKPENYVVVMTDSDKKNQSICQLLRNDFQHENIITKVKSDKLAGRLKNLNVETLDTTRIMASTIENLILRPTTYHALIDSFETLTVEEIIITNKEIDGTQVKDLAFHTDGQLMLVRKNDEVHIPHGETYLHLGDIITVFGNDEALEDFRGKFG